MIERVSGPDKGISYDEYRAQLDRGEPLTLEQASLLLEFWAQGVRSFFQEHESWHKEHDRAERLEAELQAAREVVEALRCLLETVVERPAVDDYVYRVVNLDAEEKAKDALRRYDEIRGGGE